jgi:hypothetical protein
MDRHRIESRWSRAAQWLLHTRAMTEAKGGLERASRNSPEFRRRAGTAFEMAELASSRNRPDDAGSWLPLTAELYRQAAYWALRATLPEDPGAAPADIWRALHPEVIREVTEGDPERHKIAARFVGATYSFIDLSELSKAEHQSVVPALRDLAALSLSIAERPQAELERIRFWRAVRLLLACGPCTAFAIFIFVRATYRPNLAAAAPWRASSTWAQCFPELRECGEAITGVFFHTNEQENPWIEFDFGSATRFSSLAVENRRDCCRERAAPLIAEVSDDGEHYREFARIDSEFAKWNRHFAPQLGRYLRLRVPRTSTLHLESVEVFP